MIDVKLTGYTAEATIRCTAATERDALRELITDLTEDLAKAKSRMRTLDAEQEASGARS